MDVENGAVKNWNLFCPVVEHQWGWCDERCFNLGLTDERLLACRYGCTYWKDGNLILINYTVVLKISENNRGYKK